jgi:hypothetical protein
VPNAATPTAPPIWIIVVLRARAGLSRTAPFPRHGRSRNMGCGRLTRTSALAAVVSGLSLLAFSPVAHAAFPGANGSLALEISDYSDSGVQFDSAASADAKLAVAAAHGQPHALLSCMGGGLTDDNCRAGGTCPDPTQGTTLCLDGGRPSFSADGMTIAFTNDPCSRAFCRRLALVGADGAGQRLLSALTADDSQAAFLPDGRLVFSGRATPGAPQDLYTVSPTGTGLSRLTGGGGAEAAPCADGSIAYVHRGDLYLLAPAGRSRRRLTFRGASRPDCAPGNGWIAFLRRSDVYLISRSGKAMRRLTSGAIATGAPSFSPDGTLIAFDSSHRPSRAWPSRDSTDHINATIYLEVTDLRGRRRRAPAFLGTDGADIDGFPFGTAAGGVSWQPLAPTQ